MTGKPSNDLRTRIAIVLCDLYEHKCCDECDVNRIESRYREYLDDADAVIRELQLTEDGGVIVGCIHD